MEGTGGTVAEGSEDPEGMLSWGHMTSVPAWGGDFRAVTASRAFGGGTVTTAPPCSHGEVITLWKFNWIAWHLSKLLTQPQLETHQALTQQHLLTSASKWEIETFKEDEVWEGGKGNEQITLYTTAGRDVPNQQVLHSSQLQTGTSQKYVYFGDIWIINSYADPKHYNTNYISQNSEK